MLPGWTREALLEEAIVRPRTAVVPFPGLRRVESPGWDQIITPALKQGGLNEVTRFQVDGDDAAVEAAIDAALAPYAEAGSRFKWPVAPDSRPADLPERLRRRGLAETAIAVMVAAADALSIPPSPAVTVEPARGGLVDAYVDVLIEGWGMADGAVRDYHRVAAESPSVALYLASVDGVPAGAGGCFIFERSLYLQGAVVLPRFRSLGAYRALVSARLALARYLGLPLLTIQAMATTSAPILARSGFTTLATIPSFSNP